MLDDQDGIKGADGERVGGREGVAPLFFPFLFVRVVLVLLTFRVFLVLPLVFLSVAVARQVLDSLGEDVEHARGEEDAPAKRVGDMQRPLGGFEIVQRLRCCAAGKAFDKEGDDEARLPPREASRRAARARRRKRGRPGCPRRGDVGSVAAVTASGGGGAMPRRLRGAPRRQRQAREHGREGEAGGGGTAAAGRATAVGQPAAAVGAGGRPLGLTLQMHHGDGQPLQPRPELPGRGGDGLLPEPGRRGPCVPRRMADGGGRRRQRR